ncbi:MAG: glycosyltransferase family 2 protein [Deltaproteobacteria bacterium]|nr:glycosyltransferase family 2 protein [Deltaproteobacteria bacterium]
MDETKTELLSIVVPAYNEEEVLQEFHQRLTAVLSGIQMNPEIIYVNDGSNDKTFEVMSKLRDMDSRVAILDLSRNFGKEIALSAGLQKANGDAVVIIDADLQHPPELIQEFIKEWKNGYDVVYGKRIDRSDETVLKKVTSYIFYRFIQQMAKVKIPENSGDFRLLSRRAVNAINSLQESHRFMKGLFAWIGYPQKAIVYKVEPRKAGKTKWSYWGLWNLAIEGITSFSTIPLRISTVIGIITALGSFLYGLYLIMITLIYGNPVPGYPSLIVLILFLGGVQLVSIGVMGEYLGRVFNETKQRPLYFVNNYLPSRQEGDELK